jgi:hypothetical protein
MMARSKVVRTKSATVTEGVPAEPALDDTLSGQAPAATEEERAQAVTDVWPFPRRRQRRSNLTPLRYMLRVMRDRTAEPARRDEMAKLALPYLHLKPAAPEPSGRTGGPIDTTDLSATEIARRIAFIKRWGALTGESGED